MVLQRYRRQPWLRHFWVQCDACSGHKLYWPTARQLRLAERLNCRASVDEVAPTNVIDSYARTKGMPVTGRRAPLAVLDQDLGFLTSMLAATSGPTPVVVPVLSYFPAHWAN